MLGAIGAPVPPPAPVAGFLALLKPLAGNLERAACVDGFDVALHVPSVRHDWPVAISPVAGAGCEPAVFIVPVAPAAPGPRRFRLRFLPPIAAVQVPALAVVSETDFESLREAAALLSTDLAGAAQSLQPAPVVRLVVAAADLVPAAMALHLPAFGVVEIDDFERLRQLAALLASDLAGPAQSLQPAPVVRLVVAAADLVPAAMALHLPVFGAAEIDDFERLRQLAALLTTDLAGAAQSLQPAPVARLVAPAVALGRAESDAQAAALSLPKLAPIAALSHGLWRTMPLGMNQPAQASGGTAHPHDDAAPLPVPPAERLPRFDTAACFDPPPAPGKTVVRPPASEAWMASPAAAPVARTVLPAMADCAADTLGPLDLPRAVEPLTLAVPPRLPACSEWQAAPGPAASLVDAIPSLIADPVLSIEVRLPGLPSWQATDSPQFTSPIPALAAPRGGVRPKSSSEPSMAPLPALPAPAAVLVAASMIGSALPPRRASTDAPARRLAGTPAATLPHAAFAALDFHCRPKPGAVAKRLQWITPEIEVGRPRMSVRPLFDRWEDLVPRRPESKFGFAKIVAMPLAVRQIAAGKRTRHTVGAVAAGLFLGTSLWLGTTSRQRVGENIADAAVPTEAPAVAAQGRTAPGAMSRLRQAISDRAAASWSDSFRGGMEAWGAGAKSWAPGWTRSADGYVQPGSLAIFHPTVNYTDYKLEFFGQIERKSMDWVVRARDARNYYAMKFTVVQPGLRPYIAMVHYAVVGGKRGRYSETPLGVMVHKGRPMQVMVDVHGNRFTASVDGEEVESWSDNALSSGGVGFFADAGEKARLYWMKVSKNEDLLGRICAYIAGSSGRQSAELWPGEPGGHPHRGGPDEPFQQPAEALSLAAVVTLRRSRVRKLHSTPRENFAQRRIETWRS